MISFKNGVTLSRKQAKELDEKDSLVLSKGFTPKVMMRDQCDHPYLAKSPDPLTVSDVFKGYLPANKLTSSDPKLQKHCTSLEFEGAFLELLVPCLMKALFKDLIIVPEVYLHVDIDNKTYIYSKLLMGFDEFLHHKTNLKFGNLLQREALPRRQALQLTEDEAFIIGQLYAAALIFNHWDVLNSKLLNSGLVEQDDTKRACIVDFGFCCHLSYKGRHNDSLCEDDENFQEGKKIGLRFFSRDYVRDYRHRFALPFDVKVGSLLPHTLIEDLFEISGKDSISLSMRNGFQSIITQALKSIRSEPRLYSIVLQSCFDRFSKESVIQPHQLKQWINMSYYADTVEEDTLFNTIVGRIEDCERLLEQAQNGIDMLNLQENARDVYVKRQTF